MNSTRLWVKSPHNKLVLVDGNAILHRAFHALPPLTTRSGEPINAVYGLISMLLRVISDLKPTHIAVCFDVKAPTFRKKLFKEYQSQRPPTHDDLSSQFEKAKCVIRAFDIPIYEKSGFEADDVIGTLAKQASRMEEVVIVTGDRDILQLVDRKVKLYMPISGLSSGKLMGVEETIEKMGVTPELIPDYKALVGDPSDNYKGVAGIGPKTAISLLGEFGSFKNIYKNINKVLLKTREKLTKDRKNAILSYKLATIVKNVPVKLDLESAGRWDVDSGKVIELFKEYGFKTLADRVKKEGQEHDGKKQMKLL
ncbi:MAG: 5'-3' exonuclease H3TH domain-containing protein [bacterium]|nr:5'-3' exonuclease H3TH domain-containing protein [bacterium]